MDRRTFTSALFVLTLIPSLGSSSPLLGQQTGVIEGTISLVLGAQKRWASRYPGAGPTTARVHPVPAVVYLLGDFPQESPAGAVVEIVQRDGLFTPGALAVRTGTTVAFPNEDPFFSQHLLLRGPPLRSGSLPLGGNERGSLRRTRHRQDLLRDSRVHARRGSGDRGLFPRCPLGRRDF